MVSVKRVLQMHAESLQRVANYLDKVGEPELANKLRAIADKMVKLV